MSRWCCWLRLGWSSCGYSIDMSGRLSKPNPLSYSNRSFIGSSILGTQRKSNSCSGQIADARTELKGILNAPAPAPVKAEPSKEDGQPQHVKLKVVSQDGSSTQFQIKPSTQLKKLMDTYCQRHGLNKASVRFMFDGQPINDTDTPALLEMEENDTIGMREWTLNLTFLIPSGLF
eukprot:gene3216-5937_t